MLRRITQRAAVVGATLAAVAALTGGTASAADTWYYADSCPGVIIPGSPGSVCLTLADNPDQVIVIQEGESATFDPAISITGAANSTVGTSYCFSGDGSIGPSQVDDFWPPVTVTGAYPC
ncbi:hypothetical protein [Streptomyces sp. NPDC055400]